jgi:hypothetical protein
MARISSWLRNQSPFFCTRRHTRFENERETHVNNNDDDDDVPFGPTRLTTETNKQHYSNTTTPIVGRVPTVGRDGGG